MRLVRGRGGTRAFIGRAVMASRKDFGSFFCVGRGCCLLQLRVSLTRLPLSHRDLQALEHGEHLLQVPWGGSFVRARVCV